MSDLREGLAADGTIRTGADRARIPARFVPLLDGVARRILAVAPDASVYVDGSVDWRLWSDD